MIKDDDLQEAYDAYTNLTAALLEEFSPVALAGVMAVQALSLYKTVLEPNEYESMVNTLYESRDRVKVIKRPSLQ
jgi:hypothetical protein